VTFTCNLCGARNTVDVMVTEPSTCACGSNVRLRSLIHLLSLEIFGESLILKDFPRMKSIRGFGMTDKDCLAPLAEKFDYTNTHYDREPRLDITQPHPELAGQFDFLLSADVLEHIAGPVAPAMEEMCRLLKPNGFAGITIFCNPQDQMREHFPNLHDYRLVSLGGRMVLVNRRADGTLEAHDNLIFHGGTGSTLEIREFGVTALRDQLLSAGFKDVLLLTEEVPEIGIVIDHDLSQPLLARKEPYALGPESRAELVRMWRKSDEQLRLARDSRWLKLGRALRVGPDFKW